MPDERLGALEFLSNATRAREAHYRERAAHLRMMAEDEPLSRLRHRLADLAEHFEQLADRAALDALSLSRLRGERGEAVKKSRARLPPGLSSRWRAIHRVTLRNGKHG